MSSRTYLSCAETAKLLRAALKESFPGVKFSVRSSKSSSIYIGWTDGPSSKQVKEVSSVFEGAYFDGMIDFEGRNYHSLDGKPVQFGAKYIFENRHQTKAYVEGEIAYFAEKFGRDDWVVLAGGECGGWYAETARDAPSIQLYREEYAEAHGMAPKESATLARIKLTGDDGYGAGTVGPTGDGSITAQGYPRDPAGRPF